MNQIKKAGQKQSAAQHWRIFHLVISCACVFYLSACFPALSLSFFSISLFIFKDLPALITDAFIVPVLQFLPLPLLSFPIVA
ncbi:hypothetical protein J3F83DRAFT_720956 [Trichoderma novae-zelandiae]